MANYKRPQVGALDHEAVMAAVTIEPTVLNEEFIRLPSDMAYWMSVYCDAIETLLGAKRQLDAGESQIRLEYKSQARERPTESYLDSCVFQDPRYRVLKEGVDRAEVIKQRAHAVVESLRAKRDMLISLGAHIRAEMEQQLTIRKGPLT